MSQERVIKEVNEYRKKKKQQQWSQAWNVILATSLLLVCLYIFFFAWPTVEQV
jgi:cytochrome bd-type quinol oxidase subunit 2